MFNCILEEILWENLYEFAFVDTFWKRPFFILSLRKMLFCRIILKSQEMIQNRESWRCVCFCYVTLRECYTQFYECTNTTHAVDDYNNTYITQPPSFLDVMLMLTRSYVNDINRNAPCNTEYCTNVTYSLKRFRMEFIYEIHAYFMWQSLKRSFPFAWIRIPFSFLPCWSSTCVIYCYIMYWQRKKEGNEKSVRIFLILLALKFGFGIHRKNLLLRTI